MRSPHPGLESIGLDADERAIVAYEELWQSGRPSLERFWAKLGPDRPMTLLSSLVKVELQHRFERGERPRAAEYLDRFPELAEISDRVVSVVYEEFCLLEEAGDRPDPSEFVEVYGEWRDSLMSQLVYHRELSQVAGVTTPTVKFPVEGDRFGSYRLRSVLGTGGAAKVYLATDDDLDDRQVALKISASVGREPSIMAKLDHRNIVPILGVTQSDEAGLSGFCMPYRPGVTLEELIRRIGRGEVPRKAKAIWDLLDPVKIDQAPDPIKLDREGWAGFPVRGSFSEAVAWIGLALSHALVYLHDRGVRHRDIKPANVLLAYREGPQLLDFNLAHDRVSAEQAQAALRGGTLPYMAPEQLRAFVDPTAWSGVDSPADIYALGLILRELVSGMAPELPNRHFTLPRAIQTLHDRRASPGVPLHKINPSVPPAFESIIAKCLEFEPSHRYATADGLAEDLRRFLDRRPLKVAENTSVIERGANWFHRNRNPVGGLTIVLALGLAMLLVPKANRSIERDPDFQAAVIEFEAGTADRRDQTKLKFERLHDAYRTSAWPNLYLGLILEDGNHPKTASKKFIEACDAGDAERAIKALLEKRPGSASLQTTLGLYFQTKGRLNEARSALLKSIAIKPEGPATLALLAKVEQQSGNIELAIDYLKRALRSGEAGDGDPDTILNRRAFLLFLLAKHVEGKLAFVKDEKVRKQIASELDAMVVQQGELDSVWPAGAAQNVENLRHFIKHFYDGVVATTRGMIAPNDGSPTGARAEFERSAECFRNASKVNLNQGDRGRYHAELIRYSALNTHRIDKLPPLPKTSAAIPSSPRTGG